jgi:hypothetical protein
VIPANTHLATPTSDRAGQGSENQADDGEQRYLAPVLPQHADEHRPQRPILLAID